MSKQYQIPIPLPLLFKVHPVAACIKILGNIIFKRLTFKSVV